MDLPKLDQKIHTLSHFAAKLSSKTGLNYEDCMLLLKTFCTLLGEDLEEGNILRIPILGAFTPAITQGRGFNYMEQKVVDRMNFKILWKCPKGLRLRMKYRVRKKLGIPVDPSKKWKISKMVSHKSPQNIPNDQPAEVLSIADSISKAKEEV